MAAPPDRITVRLSLSHPNRASFTGPRNRLTDAERTIIPQVRVYVCVCSLSGCNYLCKLPPCWSSSCLHFYICFIFRHVIYDNCVQNYGRVSVILSHSLCLRCFLFGLLGAPLAYFLIQSAVLTHRRTIKVTIR